MQLLYEFFFIIVKITEKNSFLFPPIRLFFSFFFTSTTFSFTCRTFFRLLFWIVCSAHNTAPHHIRRLSTKYEDVRFNWYGNRYLKQKERMKERTTDLSICIESSSCQMLLLNFILFFPVLAFPSCICKHYHKERIDLCSIDDKKEEEKKLAKKNSEKNAQKKRYINGHCFSLSSFCCSTLNRYWTMKRACRTNIFATMGEMKATTIIKMNEYATHR